MANYKRMQAAQIIEEHFAWLNRSQARRGPDDITLVDGKEAGRKMVEIYRLLTGEMPQVPGLGLVFHQDEFPAVEFASPIERDPSDIQYVYPSQGPGPDIIVPGDQSNASTRDKRPREIQPPQKSIARSRTRSDSAVEDSSE